MEKTEKKLIVFIPSIEDGGVEKNLFLILKYLSKKIRSIDLITFNNNQRDKFDRKINIITPSFNFFSFSSRLPKYIFCLFTLICKLIIDRNCVIFSFQANIYVIMLAKFFRVKIISRSNSSSVGWSKNFIKQFIFSFFFKRATKILVNSYDFKKEMDKKYGLSTECILNPFEFKKIKKKSLEKCKKIYSKKNRLKLISVGRLTYQKDFLTLLKAINILKEKRNFELIIIGKGNDQRLLENYISDNGLKNRVKLIGYQKNPFKFINQADIFLLTSIFEGSPNVLVEALYLKKYIISTNCPTGPNEILKNGEYGSLVKTKDFKKIAKILENFKYNRMNKKKVLNGFNSLKRFDHKINCKKYLKLIQKYIK